MREPKLGGMQRLTVKLQFLQYLAMRLSRTTVNRVAEHRMTDRGHVDPDLVRAARLEPAFDERGVVQEIQPPPARHRPLAALAFDDRDLLAVRRRAGERRVDRPFVGLRNAADDRQIAPVDRMGGELPGATL